MVNTLSQSLIFAFGKYHIEAMSRARSNVSMKNLAVGEFNEHV
jgi:hypothetical protein